MSLINALFNANSCSLFFLNALSQRTCCLDVHSQKRTSWNRLVTDLGDLKKLKSTGTSCQIGIHFSSQTSKFPIKYNLLWIHISGGLIIFFTKHDYKVSTSFIKKKIQDISDNHSKMDFYSVASSSPFECCVVFALRSKLLEQAVKNL